MTEVTWNGRILLKGMISLRKSGTIYCSDANNPKRTPKSNANSANMINPKAVLFLFMFTR